MTIPILVMLLVIVIYIAGIIIACKYYPELFNHNDHLPPPPGF
jgi:hypothetical protein